MADPLDEPRVVGALKHESGVFFPELLFPGELTLFASHSFLGCSVCPVAALFRHVT
jgi:hypothetical protein